MTTDDGVPVGRWRDMENLRGPARAMKERFDRAVLDLVGSVPATKVLDVGCGEGFPLRQMAAAYPDRSFTGVDFEHPKLRVHWDELRSERIRFRPGDAMRLPFDTERFPLVTAIEVLEHLADPDAALHEIRRVCPTGWLVASVPWEILWRLGNLATLNHVTRLGNTPGHVKRWWTPGHFARFLSRHGTVECLARPVPWTVALVRLARSDR